MTADARPRGRIAHAGAPWYPRPTGLVGCVKRTILAPPKTSGAFHAPYTPSRQYPGRCIPTDFLKTWESAKKDFQDEGRGGAEEGGDAVPAEVKQEVVTHKKTETGLTPA